MRKHLILAVAALASLALLQPLTHAAGLSSAGTSAITTFLQGAVDRGEMPGIVALVVDRNGVIYHEAFGKQDVGRNVPMAKDSIFRIASMTKAITSMGVMILVEEGKVKLDDDAAKYVPSMANRRVFTKVDTAAGTYETKPATRPITIRQLLTHTSGIGYNWSDHGLALVQQKENPAEDALPLVYEPGENWTYGSSTRVLGDVIQAVTGQRVDAFIQARIAGPLGMKDTAFEVPRDRNGRVVTTHQKTNGRFKETPNPETITAPVRGDGGLFSTADDYGRFIRMILSKGTLNGTRVLAEKTVDDVGRNHMGKVVVRQQPTANPDRSLPYPLGAGRDGWGLGFQRAAAPLSPNMRSEGSLAWAGIWNTEFWIDPARGIGAVLLMQYLPFYDDAAIKTLQGFEQRVNQALTK
jgi:CubicO group peptidase (beta-lactamase class C family)